MTRLRPVEAADVDLLVAWHAADGVARYWDGTSFTRESMLARLARPKVTPNVVAEHLQPWVLMEVRG